MEYSKGSIVYLVEVDDDVYHDTQIIEDFDKVTKMIENTEHPIPVTNVLKVQVLHQYELKTTLVPEDKEFKK